MNNLDPLARQRIIASLARLQPASVFRLSTTSRTMQAATANKMKQINALKRAIRRRRAIKLHFEHREPGFSGRLRNPLFEAKIEAHRRTRMTTPTRRLWAARRAYSRYEQKGTQNAWNEFVRAHAKRGIGNIVTRKNARNIYN